MKREVSYPLRILNAFAVVCLLALAPLAQSAPVTLVGDTISYEYDDEQAALALFGKPMIVGDVVRFLPGEFRAQSVNGAGADIVSAVFLFDRVYTHSDADIGSIEVVERGDYRIFGDGAVSTDLALLASNNNDFSESVSDSDSVGASGNGALQEFTLTAGLDVAGSFDSVANDIALSISNDLFAVTDANGQVAWVQKKLAFTAVSQVPLPAAAWLFMSALAGLVVTARRRSAQVLG